VRANGWAASALIYTAATAILGRDVLAQLGTTIANDPGDPLLTAAILHWNAGHVPWTDAWWQFPIFHPTRDALAFSEHLLGLSVVAAPIAWLTGNPLAAYNLTLLLTFPLSGMAMFALVHRLTGNAAGAFLAGLAYAFAPYRISNLPHIQMLASFWAPLALVGLHGFLEIERRSQSPGAAPIAPRAQVWWLALYGGAWALQAAANWYSLVLFSVFVGLWVIWFVVMQRRWRALMMIAGATVVAAIPLLPIVQRYLAVHGRHGFERSLAEVRAYSADVAALLCAPPNLTFWGWLNVSCRAEGELFPGTAIFLCFLAAVLITVRRWPPADAASMAQRLPERLRGVPPRTSRASAVVIRVLLAVAAVYTVVLVLLLIFGPLQLSLGFISISASDVDKPLLIALAAGIAALLMVLVPHAWRRPESAISFYLCAAIVTWLLALGPTVTFMGEPSGRPGPFVLLQALPGVGGLRVPARFWLFTVLCLATIVGLLVPTVLSRIGQRGRIAVAVLTGFALLSDGWTARIPAQPPPPTAPAVALLRDRVVLELPVEPYPDIGATWRAVTGGWRSINGYSGYAPNYYTALTVASRLADETMFAPFQRRGDVHVVVADASVELKMVVERQPGVTRTAQGNGFTQYLLPRRETEPGSVLRKIPMAAVRSDCAAASVGLAHDDDESSRWECLEHADVHGLVVDLGTPMLVGAVMYSIGFTAWAVPTEILVEGSADGATWQTLRSGSILGDAIEGGLAHAGALRTVLSFPVQRTRYVRLRPVNQPEGFGWLVSEIEVRGP
jgi:hypothetical protein